MKVLLDTNVLVAAFISHGCCHELLEHCFHHHDIVTTNDLLKEFRDVMLRKFRFSRTEARDAVQVLRLMIDVVKAQPLEEPVCRDADDDRVLAAAVGSARGPVVIDVRRRAAREASGRAIAGSRWREHTRVQAWCGELEAGE